MKWQGWVLSIVGAVIVAGIGGVAAATLGSARTAAANEERVHAIAVRLDEHGKKLEEIEHGQVLLERIDERVGDMVRRLERVESKMDERQRAPRR